MTIADTNERNILLTVAYDGSGFHGWQRQRNGVRTVQGVLEERLTRVCGEPVALEGTSRTDAGVHALGQRVTWRGCSGIPTKRIPGAVNNSLDDIIVLSAEERPEDFHARFSATGKTYVYKYAVRPPLPVFVRNYACLLAAGLNTDRIAEAVKYLIGTYDFASFQAAGGTPRETTVRTIFGADVRQGTGRDPAGNTYETVEIEVTGDGFLYNMVRIIAGTLAAVGTGDFTPEEIAVIIEKKDRAFAGPTAPPQGLYLKEVYFEDFEGFEGMRI